MCCNLYSLRIVLREGSKGVEMVIAFPGGFDLICVYWFSYRNRVNKGFLTTQLFSSSPPDFGGRPRISGKRHKW